jgi:hypothetical protein
MSYKYDVFVSYASEDRVFARRLVQWLEQADSALRVWFAEEDMVAGSDVQRTIVEDVESTRHSIFVVSDAWLDKKWTRWERDLVLKDHAATRDVSVKRCIVPVLRSPRDVGRLGPELHALKSVGWQEGETEADARFWEVLCGLGFYPLGKEEEWAAKGRQARGESSSILVAAGPDEAETRGVRQAKRGSSHLALTCDRYPQWGELTDLAGDGRHEAILVAGPQGEGHKFFLQRVVSCWPGSPGPRICEVSWRLPRPLAKGAAFDRIAEAIECPPGQLETSLRQILSASDLVLVHQPPFEEADCDTLIRYYTEWLPELVAAVDRPAKPLEWNLKVVQAIRWPQVGTLKCGLFQAARLLKAGPRRLRSECAKAEAARELMAKLEKTSGDLPICLLEQLAPIERPDVEKWSKKLDLADEIRTEFVDDVAGAGSSVAILNRIVEKLGP